VTFDIEKARAFIQQVKHDLPVIEVSCTSGEGLSQWYEWLKSKVPAAQEA
jgi:hydrogenase nickel incorporation protein HypB